MSIIDNRKQFLLECGGYDSFRTDLDKVEGKHCTVVIQPIEDYCPSPFEYDIDHVDVDDDDECIRYEVKTGSKEEIANIVKLENGRRQALNLQKEVYKRAMSLLSALKVSQVSSDIKLYEYLRYHMPPASISHKIYKCIGLRKYYTSVEDALKAISGTNVIVYVAGLYIVFTSIDHFDYLMYRLSTYTDNSLQLIKDDIKQKVFFTINTQDEDILDRLQKVLLIHFGKELTKHNITITPYGGDKLFIVLDSIWEHLQKIDYV